jgi:hypothetical protein
MMRSLSRESSKLTRTARSDRQVLRRAIGASDLHLPHGQPIQLQQCSGQAVTAGQMEQGSFYCNAQVKRQFCKIVGGVTTVAAGCRASSMQGDSVLDMFMAI